MNKFTAKKAALKRRQRRVRAKIFGTAERPRLNVRRTNAHMYAQIIDDADGKEAAELVGELVAKRALAAGVTEVTFDRGGRIYHGRVKALADGARNAGLKF